MAIAYIRRGKPIAPPLVIPTAAEKPIGLGGRNHRYRVAKFSGKIELPIYVDQKKAERIAPM